MEGRLSRLLARSAGTGRSSTRTSPRRTTSSSARRSTLTPPGGTILALEVSGHLRPAHGRLAVRSGDVLGATSSTASSRTREHLHVHHACGAARRREHGGARAALAALPERQGADEAAVHRQPDRRAERSPEHPLRPACPLGPGQPLRHRQHAGADGVRADARARHAARGRHDAATDAADDPARERDHRADRRRCSGSCWDRPRRAARRRGWSSSASRCPLASSSSSPSGRLRRHHRGDLPGPAGRQA